MDIKSLWDKFLELRKSPACIIFSIIGLLDIFVLFIVLTIAILEFLCSFYTPYSNIIYIVINNIGAFLYYLVFLMYMIFRISGLPYYIAIIIGLFIIEKIFKLELKNNFIENNKKYMITWLVGFFMAIIFSFLWKPFFEFVIHSL